MELRQRGEKFPLAGTWLETAGVGNGSKKFSEDQQKPDGKARERKAGDVKCHTRALKAGSKGRSGKGRDVKLFKNLK
jgi:hypothetical protein